nr:death domain-containing protein CRADD isoform X1 [Nothobranchius furzeri]XP_054595927.1 death domain-containing protein CRADD isoform X1 [Nothobranchius furzeri]
MFSCPIFICTLALHVTSTLSKPSTLPPSVLGSKRTLGLSASLGIGPEDGARAQSRAPEAPGRNVRPAAGQRYHRSVSVPGGHFNGRTGGGDRESGNKQTENPEAAGNPADPRASGLPHLPAGPAGLQLGPRQTAAGAPGCTWTCRGLLDPRLGSPEDPNGPGIVPASITARDRVGGGSDGSGAVSGGSFPMPVRSHSEYAFSSSCRPGSVETGGGKEGHVGLVAAESSGRWSPSVCPTGCSGMRRNRVSDFCLGSEEQM